MKKTEALVVLEEGRARVVLLDIVATFHGHLLSTGKRQESKPRSFHGMLCGPLTGIGFVLSAVGLEKPCNFWLCRFFWIWIGIGVEELLARPSIAAVDSVVSVQKERVDISSSRTGRC